MNLKERSTATSAEEAVEIMQRGYYDFPILIIPWSEQSCADYYEAFNFTQLREVVPKALDDALIEERVHLVQSSMCYSVIIHSSESFMH